MTQPDPAAHGLTPTGSSPPTPPAKVAVGKQPFDWQHAGLVVAFVGGVGYGLVPLIVTAEHGGGTVNGGQIITGVAIIAATAVGAFFKKPPGSLVEAFEEGEAASRGKTP